MPASNGASRGSWPEDVADLFRRRDDAQLLADLQALIERRTDLAAPQCAELFKAAIDRLQERYGVHEQVPSGDAINAWVDAVVPPDAQTGIQRSTGPLVYPPDPTAIGVLADPATSGIARGLLALAAHRPDLSDAQRYELFRAGLRPVRRGEFIINPSREAIFRWIDAVVSRRAAAAHSTVGRPNVVAAEQGDGSAVPPPLAAPAPEVVARYARLEETGRAAVRAWICHPAVARDVVAAQPALRQLVEPLELTDQWDVTIVVARLLDLAGRYPDGSIWPDPLIGAPGPIVDVARRISPLLVDALADLADRLALADVPLDPADRSIWLVLAQLALLDFDFARPAADLVDDLNVLPPGWIDREAAERGHVAASSSRHGRTVRFRADLDAFGEDVAQHMSPLAAIQAPYAGATRRRPPTGTRQEARRAALRAVLVDHPTVTPGRLRATWDAGPSTPGGALREALELQEHDPPPSKATLEVDLRELRA